MKTYFSFFILVVICSMGLAAEKTTLSDNEISKLLIGKWRTSINENNVKIDAVDEFLPNGKVISKGVVTVSNQQMNIEMERTWKIENGKLISTLLFIKPIGMMPLGSTTTDTVISIDNEKCVSRGDTTGELSTQYRVNEKANETINPIGR